MDVGTYLTNEYTNIWIDEMDRFPDQTIGELHEHLKERTLNSHACYFGTSKMKEWPVSIFFGYPKEGYIPSYQTRKSNPVDQKTATYAGLMTLMRSDSPSIRAKARLTLHELKSLSKKLDFVLEAIINELDPNNAKILINSPCGPVTPEYLKVLRYFNSKIGKINPDDMGKFYIINNIVARYGLDKTINAINTVL